MAGDLRELPRWATGLLDSERVARLGMLDLEGRPRVQPVTFAVCAGRIWSAVDAKPKSVPASRLARIRFLRADPRVALTVDVYDEDWRELAWVQVLGRISVVGIEDDAAPGTEAGSALRELVDKYPQYRESSPEGPLLALSVDRCLCWRAAG